MVNRQEKETTIVASLYKLNMEAEKVEGRGLRVVSSREEVNASMEIKETSQQEGQAVGKDKEKETVKGKENQGEGESRIIQVKLP